MNYESSFEAFLYVKSSDNINSISKETYLNIISAIYYEYFYIWYSDFLDSDELNIYKQKIDVCFESIQKSLINLNSCEIKYADCPLIKASSDEKTYGHLPTKKKRNIRIIPLITVLVFVCPIVIVWGYNSILQLLNIPLSSANTIIGGFFSAAITSISALIISKKKS
jgi:hypothetical protein